MGTGAAADGSAVSTHGKRGRKAKAGGPGPAPAIGKGPPPPPQNPAGAGAGPQHGERRGDGTGEKEIAHRRDTDNHGGLAIELAIWAKICATWLRAAAASAAGGAAGGGSED